MKYITNLKVIAKTYTGTPQHPESFVRPVNARQSLTDTTVNSTPDATGYCIYI